MALALVAYDDSDESDTDVDIRADSKNKNVTPNLNASSATDVIKIGEKSSPIEEVNTNISDEEEEEKEVESKFHIPESKVKLLNTDIDIKCLTGASNKSGPVKITIPSLNEVEGEDEQPVKKKLKPSKSGSGLFALLPNPKSTLVPQSVVNRKNNANNKQTTKTAKPTKSVPKDEAKTTPLITYEDSGDENESSGTDFFNLDSKNNEVTEPADDDDDVILLTPEASQPEPIPPSINNDALQFSDSFQPPAWQVASNSLPSHQPPSEYPTEEFMTFNNTDLELNQEAMQQLCGRRDRLKMQEVNLIDVSGDAIMSDTREWLTKQMTEEQTHRPSHKKRDGPTSQQKRKHQITYLAYQAKENELELKNQWANNRMSRKQTQAKYGF